MTYIIISILLCSAAILGYTKDWQKFHPGVRRSPIVITILLAMVNIYDRWASQKRHDADSTRSRAENAELKRQNEELKQTLMAEKSDADARHTQYEAQLRLLADCIPDPKKRKQAQSVGALYRRELSEHIGIDDKVSASSFQERPTEPAKP